jgi:hypothetical protein
MDPNEVAQLVAEAMKQVQANRGEQLREGRKASGTSVGPYAHGPGGLFSLVDGENPLLSAMLRPKGMLSVLPFIRADQHVTEFFNTLTGVTAATGSEPVGICDDPRTAGLKKLCTLAVPFGRNRLKTREWNVLRSAKLKDRTEELSLGAAFPVNLYQQDNFFPMSDIATAGVDVARTELGNRLFELAVEFQRTVGPELYTGSPANNSNADPDAAGYKEPIGFQTWINAGNKRDARSSAICKALDSDIKDFGHSDVAATGASAKNIVQYLTQMYRYAKWNSERMGLDPVEFVIAMRVDLFDMISDIWPCSYLSNRCSTPVSGANIVVVNDDLNVRMRDEMRNGSYLWIDGVMVPVVRDGSIPEENWSTPATTLLPGQFASDIYIIPMTVLGGMRVTGFQYFDQRLSVQASAAARDVRLWTTDNGLFLWNSTNKDLCYDIRVSAEWRLIVQTPQLAGRLLNVKYAPLQHLRESDPNALYYLDGGVTSQPIEKYYNQWTDTQKQM